MKKKREPFPIANVIDTIFKKTPVKKKNDYLLIYKTWKQTVGENIAGNTRPEGIRGDVLFVGVSNSIWMQELSFIKKNIVKKINETLSETKIKDIRFRISDFARQTSVKAPEALPELTDDEKLLIAKAVSVIKDDGLRKAFEGVMASYISGRK